MIIKSAGNQICPPSQEPRFIEIPAMHILTVCATRGQGMEWQCPRNP